MREKPLYQVGVKDTYGKKYSKVRYFFIEKNDRPSCSNNIKEGALIIEHYLHQLTRFNSHGNNRPTQAEAMKLKTISRAEYDVTEEIDPDCEVLNVGENMNTLLYSLVIKKNHPLLLPMSKAIRELLLEGTIENLMRR